MLPRDSVNRVPDGAIIYAILFSEMFVHYFARRIKRACFSNDAVCQDGLRSAFAVGHPSFVRRINKILAGSSEKQMIGTYASANVTVMADKRASWDWAVCQLPSYPVSALSLVVDAELPIAAAKSAGSPQPTGFGFIDQRPKALGHWLNPARVVALLRTKLTSTFLLINWSYFTEFAQASDSLMYSGATQWRDLRYRLQNWIGSFDVCASFEPLCILAHNKGGVLPCL